ncbi:YdiU family protein [soil metagenome]
MLPVLTLGDGFYDVATPARFPKHVLRFRNQRAAKEVGLDGLDAASWEAHFARFAPLPANLQEPLALRYHGHQFGSYNPALGDGRGFLFAQLKDDRGRWLDLGTKGSGTTRYSRGGDGKLTLKGGMREVLATEMLEALFVPTSRSLSLFETGESLYRGDEPSPTRSSVLVRMSHSHVRFGTFQRLAFEKDAVRMKKLVDYALEHLLPEAASSRDPVRALLGASMELHARTAARWMVAGFVHGVLNTDNMNVTGESFDYGPWRFLPTYDPSFVAAYFDETGLYAFGRQPGTILWNLNRFADALRTVDPSLDARVELADFEAVFVGQAQAALLERLGLRSRGPDDDDRLVAHVFSYLDGTRHSFDGFFFEAFAGGRLHATDEATRVVQAELDRFEPISKSARSHPHFSRTEPVTLVKDEVERLWDRVADHDDWAAFDMKIADIRDLGAALRAR